MKIAVGNNMNSEYQTDGRINQVCIRFPVDELSEIRKKAPVMVETITLGLLQLLLQS